MRAFADITVATYVTPYSLLIIKEIKKLKVSILSQQLYTCKSRKLSPEVAPTTLAIFSLLWPWTLTHNLQPSNTGWDKPLSQIVSMTSHLVQKLILGHRQTHQTNCCTWTTTFLSIKGYNQKNTNKLLKYLNNIRKQNTQIYIYIYIYRTLGALIKFIPRIFYWQAYTLNVFILKGQYKSDIDRQ